MDISTLNVEHVQPSQLLLQYLCALDILTDARSDSAEAQQSGRPARDRE